MPLATPAVKKVIVLLNRTDVFQAELFGDIAHAACGCVLTIATVELIITDSPHAAKLLAVDWKRVSFRQ